MNLPIIIALLFAAGSQPQDGGQPFRLESGDFRWIPFTVRQTPSEVDCRFDVVSGNSSVHVELLPMSEFRLFNRGREHDTMALTPNGRSGEFRRIIDVRGQYAVVAKNERGAPPATVLLRGCKQTSIRARMWHGLFLPQRSALGNSDQFLLSFSSLLRGRGGS